MSLLLRRRFGPIVLAALAGAAALALADDTPPAATPDQGPGAAKQVPTPASPAATPGAGPATPAAPPGAAATVAPGAAGAGGDTPLYRVVDGNQVDHNTMNGWRTWRAMACERCHGANQEGLVGPSLVDDMKTMSKEEFTKCVLDGRIDKGMPNFGGAKSVTDNIDNLYAFLKGRSDGAIATGHLKEIQ
jgi:hypothetical protein